MSERYVVKLASGAWIATAGNTTDIFKDAHRASRAEAYRIAASWSAYDAVALRLKPGKRAAELAKLRGENERLLERVRNQDNQVESICAEVEELREWGKGVSADVTKIAKERDALAVQLAALPPDISDEELAKCMGTGNGLAICARTARRLLRGPVAPARPVEELRDELLDAWLRGDKDNPMGSVAKRARELGAR